MSSNIYGIVAVEFYLPKMYIDIKEYAEYNKIPKEKLLSGLGLESMSVVSEVEDTISMSKTVLERLIKRTGVNPSQIGRLEVGTETLYDKSKSIKTYLIDHFGLNKDIEGVTNLNACFGGTACLFNSIDWCIANKTDKYAIVIMCDIAVYNDIKAQPTGGAGAIALLIGQNPQVTIDPIKSFHFENADDFAKPILDSEYPIVDGEKSKNYYTNCLLQNMINIKKKYAEKGELFQLEDFEMMCFHTPYSKLVERCYLRLFYDEVQLNHQQFKSIKDPKELESFIKEKPKFEDSHTEIKLRSIFADYMTFNLYPGLFLLKKTGNIYCGSLYLSLLSALFMKGNKNMSGKKVFMYSYGSGCASCLFTLRFNDNFHLEKLINQQSVYNYLSSREKIPIETFYKVFNARERSYNKLNYETDKSMLNDKIIWKDSYFLDRVNKNGQRFYKQYKHQAPNPSNKTAYEGSSNRLNILASTFEKRNLRDMTVEERRQWIGENKNISTKLLEPDQGLKIENANLMIENCVGLIKMPLGIANNFVINDKSKIIPMVTEEPSIIAAASSAAKLICTNGKGFRAESTKNIIRGQLFLEKIESKNPIEEFELNKPLLIDFANTHLCNSMFLRDGGVVNMAFELGENNKGTLTIFLDVKDSMGANVMNTVLEGIQTKIKDVLQANVLMGIMSNLCPERIIKASFEIPVSILHDDPLEAIEIARKIIEANRFALNDLFRATTHNKGIMNGIIAVALAIGQDTRAIESSCHAYSCYKNGRYSALTNYYLKDNGNILKGEIEIPFLIGTKGGSILSNPLYDYNLKMLGDPDARELGCILASVGLAQNFAALKALVTTGIQKGHMKLHARNVALSVGIPPDSVSEAVSFMINKNKISPDVAKEFLLKMNK